ncbi:MAG: ribosome small subunit-dependent GTPase A [Armatimonadota bacterium]
MTTTAADRSDGAAPATVEGIVLEAGRGVYTVQAPGGALVACKLRGNLKKSLTYADSEHRSRSVERVRKLRETDPVAVGDRVDFALGETIGEGVIVRVHPRRATLSRQSGNERERQTLVANLEQAVIVFAAAEPRIDPYKLDRFLVLAEDAELDILIVINKSDLEQAEVLDAMADEYRRIGYPVIAASVRTGAGIAALRAVLHGRVSALCGPSGVGKSSLLNAVEPGLSLRTGATGDTTHAGRHTTVRARLLSLAGGGWVADTPGLRQVTFWDIPAEDVAFSFPEMAPLMGRCRFPDCRHRQEPGCAVRDAVESGAISERRYESYRQMTG